MIDHNLSSTKLLEMLLFNYPDVEEDAKLFRLNVTRIETRIKIITHILGSLREIRTQSITLLGTNPKLSLNEHILRCVQCSVHSKQDLNPAYEFFNTP